MHAEGGGDTLLPLVMRKANVHGSQPEARAADAGDRHTPEVALAQSGLSAAVERPGGLVGGRRSFATRPPAADSEPHPLAGAGGLRRRAALALLPAARP